MLKRTVCAFFHKHSLHIQRPGPVSVFRTLHDFRKRLKLLHPVPGTDGLPGIYPVLRVIPGICLQLFHRNVKICPDNIFELRFRNTVPVFFLIHFYPVFHLIQKIKQIIELYVLHIVLIPVRQEQIIAEITDRQNMSIPQLSAFLIQRQDPHESMHIHFLISG